MTDDHRFREPFHVGDWEVRPAESQLVCGEESVRLEPRVMAVLLRLVDSAGRVVAHADLVKSVWGGEHAIEDGALAQAIHLIRRALGDNARKPRYIETVPKVGYRLMAEVRFVERTEASPVPPRRGRGRLIAIAGLAATAALIAGYLLGLNGSPRTPDEPLRIEVLPFHNGSRDLVHVVGGLEDAFRGQLSRHRQIRTVSVRAAPENLSDEVLARRAEENALAAILVGTARPAEHPDRVEVEIHIPGERIRRFDLPLDLTGITRGLDAGLVEVCAALDLPPDPAASLGLGNDERVLDSFFRGLDALRRANSRDTVAEGIRWLRKAADLDPDHALTLAVLSHLYLEGAHQGVDRGEAYARAYQLARMAISIDPRIAEAHLALMRIMIEYRWDWDEAEEHYRHTIEINPSHWRACFQHAWLLAIWHDFDGALRDLDRAQSLVPGREVLLVARVKLLYFAGRYEEAVTLGRELAGREPPPPEIHRALGRALLALGSTDEAVATLRREAEIAPDLPLALSALGHALAVSGKTEEARSILARLEREFPSRPDRAALVWVGLGEHDEAFEALERARRIHAPGLAQVGIDPRFRPLADDPRFYDLLDRLNLPPVSTEGWPGTDSPPEDRR